MNHLLKSYVYMYSDPQDGMPFHVGKGRGNCAFAHLNETGEKKKALRISAIHERGQKPQIDLLCYGLSDDRATLVDAVVIALLGRPPLVNLVGGEFKIGYGRVSAEELILVERAKPVEVNENVMLIRINKLYRSNMSTHELYEATRGIWKLGLRRYKAQYAMAVYQGIVREVYRIDRWIPAGYSEYTTRKPETVKKRGRWEFQGEVEKELSAHYVGKSVRKYLRAPSQNPIRFIGC